MALFSGEVAQFHRQGWCIFSGRVAQFHRADGVIRPVFALATFQKDNPDFKAIEILYFRDDNKNLVQIFADGKPQGVAEIPNAFYEELCQKYADKIPDMRKDEPYIDRQWALQAMGLN